MMEGNKIKKKKDSPRSPITHSYQVPCNWSCLWGIDRPTGELLQLTVLLSAYEMEWTELPDIHLRELAVEGTSGVLTTRLR